MDRGSRDVQVAIAERIEGVEPDAALAWWSDFQPGRHDHGFLPAVHRRVEERREATTVEDRLEVLGLGLFTERVLARTGKDAVRFEGENTMARFRGVYRFEPAPGGDGTVVRLEATIRGKGPLVALERVGGGLVRWWLRYDLRRHLDQLRRDAGVAERRDQGMTGGS